MAEQSSLKLKRVAAVFLAVICFIGIFPTTAHAEYDNSQRDDVKVGFFAMDGYHMMDEEGNRSGYGWDVLRLMARYWDVTYEYVGYENSWEDMQKMLEDGEIDMVSSARKTPEREEKFDFSRPIGTNEAILTVRNDNADIIEQEYSTYDGMRVALLNGNTRNEDFQHFAEEKGFHYIPVYYDMVSDMENDLQSGKVDGIVTSSLRQTENERIIEKFDSSEFYIMVKKGNTQLLDKINYAIDQMNAVEGDWKTTLKNQHYGNYDNKNLEFTDEEKAVIKEYSSKEHPLMILCDPTRYPYSYNENGMMKGIIPDYFRKLAEYAGISYEFMNITSRDEYLEHQKDKSVGLCIDSRIPDDNWPEARNLVMSAPYITMRLAVVTRRDFDGKINTLASVDQTSAGNIEDAYAKDAKRIVYDTRQDAMQAVLDEKADAAIVYYYSAQAFVNSDLSGTLTYSLIEDTAFQYRIIVASSKNHELSGILTKSIYAMPDNLIEEIASGYTSYKASDVTFTMLIQSHPKTAIFIALIIIWVLVSMVILIARMRTRKKIQMLAQQKAEEMTVLAEQAQAANKAKSTFLSHMSHDIRTPMNAIMGFVKIALKNNPSQEIKDCLEKIEDSSDHLLSLLNDVLDLTRIESGKDKYSLEPINITKVTDTVVDIANGLINERDLNFEVYREDKDSVPNVLADQIRIREVFVNILSNAVKFTKDGGTITFSTTYHISEDGKYANAVFKISDTGIGMSQEFLSHAFEEFAQENSDARTKYAGSGLGLAIVKKYVDMMGGTISLKSALGEGTTFVVKIPFEITKEACVEMEKEVSSEDISKLKGIEILMAEDNDLNAEIATVLLEEVGMHVTRAVDGKELVTIFEERPVNTFDLILMDIMMPNMNGYDATNAIRCMKDRSDGKTIPIIAMTANAFAEDEQKCKEAGMNAHLSKPLQIEQITSTIAYFCRMKNNL